MTRAEGTTDPLHLRGEARDYYTAADGSGEVTGSASIRAAVDRAAGSISHLQVFPPVPEIESMVPVPAMSGFRSVVDRVAPQLRRARDLRYTLLDDVPVATLISGHALSASGAARVARENYAPTADLCAGFISGGVLMTSFEAGDPAVVTGPDAPALEVEDDPVAWHRMPALTAQNMRRRRRIDVSPGASPGVVAIDAMFRDSYVRADGVETVIHEYVLNADVEAESRTIVGCRASTRVLPWQECSSAAASAERSVGMTLSELHSKVRVEFVGIQTCTHLNDLLRSVADAESLIAQLALRG
ncbi:Uncharacterised protein [Mycolicibacterium vanbaalenii]|uniref:DUF2889 domain-containing protein n=1 Tax=Mycolicibacterium vanbaalenii TaxID=110539 RepID=A0A5S9RBA0_MYCVN|nr:DUF2889 domain-containing protein [Mycolicibacterium vanbaalenii]CAA0137598.1 Uncharacterised protein [Mycolicibacterium vanbaalenii]